MLRGAAWRCVGVAWLLRGCCVDAALLLRVVLRVVPHNGKPCVEVREVKERRG